MQQPDRPVKSLGLPVVAWLVASAICAAALGIDVAWLSRYRVYLVAGLVLASGIVVVRLAGYFLFDVLFRKREGREAPDILRFVVSVAGYSTLIAILYGVVFGRNVTGVLATSAVVSVILGLALQDTLGNFFAGLSLHIEQPYHIGDAIRMGEVVGRVESVTWRTSSFRTNNNSLIIVPNSRIAREAIEIFVLDSEMRRVLRIPAPYDAKPESVMAILRDTLQSVPGVLASRMPVVRIAEYGESSVVYEVLYWMTDYMSAAEIDCVIRERVWYAFRRSGLDMPFPQRHVTVETRRHVPKQPEHAIQSGIEQVDLFAPLTAAECAALARSCNAAIYAPGEQVLHCGQAGESMFVILRGRAEILVPLEPGGMKPIAVLKEGDFFGEMALFTGEARTADVRAATELELVEIGKSALQPLLHGNRELAAAFSRVIAQRQARLTAHAAAAAEQREPAAADTILTRIKRFFSLK